MITYTFVWPNGVMVTETFTPFGSAFSLVTPDGRRISDFRDDPVVEDSFADMLATLVMYN